MARSPSPDLASRLHRMGVMRIAAVIAFAAVLGACSPSDDARAKEEARRTADQARHDAKEAGHEVKVEAEKASREIDKGLHDARDKVRGALDKPDRK